MAVLILVHEFGHFIVAKKSGIRVDEFGLGFPPKILSKRFGSTLYTLNLIPFGGFVKIFGEDPHSEVISDADRSTSFYYKPKWIQALVLVAGVTMNVLFAWLVISLGFMIGMPSSPDYSGFGKVTNLHVVVTNILPDSPAQKAGLIPGDEFLELASNGQTLEIPNLTAKNVQDFINDSGNTLTIRYSRNGDSSKQATLEPSSNIIEGKKAIGIAMDELGILKLSPPLALLEGARTTMLLVKETITGLAGFFWKVVTFRSDFSEVSGPVGIASVVGQARSLGFVYLLTLIALISINLAVINLLPFPALDGGRLFFLLIEAIIRRPLPESLVRRANFFGFVILIILMLVITAHDILKLV